jgi:molybdopterin molybdotransferase
MLSVAEAVAQVTAGFVPLSAETVSLDAACGRVLAEDVAARVSQPPVAVSAMDGYAVRAADVASAPTTLRLTGESPAGRGFDGVVGPGEAVRIFTGAPVPAGADAVIIQEETDVAGNRVTVRTAAVAGRWIRPAGLDFSLGEVRLRAGQPLSPRDVALAAAMNVPQLRVRRRPRVAIIATGEELVPPGAPLAPAQIPDANSVAVTAYVRRFGGEPIGLGIARDNAASLRALIGRATGADLLVTIGGASVGDYDLVRQVLDGLGFDLRVWRVAMRPGKPMLFGRLGDLPVLGLPGNPVSAGVTALLFLRPALAAMLGAAMPPWTTIAARLAGDLPANDGRADFVRASLAHGGDGRFLALPFPRQDSAMLARFAEAGCLILREPMAPAAAAGTIVEVMPLGPDWGSI